MAIYNTVNSTHENSFRVINFKNMNISRDHLGVEQDVVDFLDKIALFSADPSYNERGFISTLYDYFKHSNRISEVKFYMHKKNIVVLVFANEFGLAKEKDFSSKVTLKCLHTNFELSIVQLPSSKYSDIQKETLSVPKGWSPRVDLTDFYRKLNIFFK